MAKRSQTKELTAFNPADHELVPTHEKLSAKEAKEILERFHAGLRELPKIAASEPALQALDVKQGDIIRITRPSHTAGQTVYYRGVIDE